MAAVDVRTSILCQGISIRHDNQIRDMQNPNIMVLVYTMCYIPVEL